MATLRFDVEIPEWARWLAQDRSGEWVIFGHEPVPGDMGEWCAEGLGYVIAVGAPDHSWRDTLHELVWTEDGSGRRRKSRAGQDQA